MNINSIEQFEDFIDIYKDDIISNIKGESDGWNQKMDIINKIIKRENININNTIWEKEYDEMVELINNI